MYRIQIQINGENPDLIGDNEKMFDSEYEIEIEKINPKQLVILEKCLNRAIDSKNCELFNYQINIIN